MTDTLTHPKPTAWPMALVVVALVVALGDRRRDGRRHVDHWRERRYDTQLTTAGDDVGL